MNAIEHTPWHDIPSFQSVDADLRRVAELIHRSLSAPDWAAELAPMLGHFIARGGKMIRPALVLLAGRCFGPVTQEHIDVSAMMEMIHGATLLHDDVVDDGLTRRGAPTVNSVWGNESAVLLGDFVLSQVFKMTVNLNPSLAGVVAQTAVSVCEGELRQVAQRRNWQLTESEYISIITDKSAAFFRGCCRIGALLAQAPNDGVEAMSRYGLNAGIAFQIEDDLLDIAGEELETGKTSQRDVTKSKLTLAIIHLLDAVGASARPDVLALLNDPLPSRDELRQMLDLHGSLDYARQCAGRYVDAAIEALAPIPDGHARDALVATARFMVDRKA
ncbi:polyprenyl synthetase family protein [Anaerobaca lacustris]|uniref:Polyprenyl synthetase family protein n=1 Tax=Anaerobaca lacustris TaxID=3044600 RepID=A0AAW6TVV1_9BACT|nr:polyprenyl synthetase family protein [Sedimentisphaerales bacterium M17dextr]